MELGRFVVPTEPAPAPRTRSARRVALCSRSVFFDAGPVHCARRTPPRHRFDPAPQDTDPNGDAPGGGAGRAAPPTRPNARSPPLPGKRMTAEGRRLARPGAVDVLTRTLGKSGPGALMGPLEGHFHPPTEDGRTAPSLGWTRGRRPPLQRQPNFRVRGRPDRRHRAQRTGPASKPSGLALLQPHMHLQLPELARIRHHRAVPPHRAPRPANLPLRVGR